VTPTLTSFTTEGDAGTNNALNYTVIVDNAPGPDLITMESLQISVKPNPGNFTLLTTQYIMNEDPPFMVQIAVCELVSAV
jgi:hypothetical protein